MREPGPARRERRSEWFEPEQPDPAPATTASAPAASPRRGLPRHPPRRTPGVWRRVLPALTLTVGLVLGFAAASARSADQPSGAPATRAPTTRPVAAPQTSVLVRPAASPACLETAKRADELINLLITDQRSRAADRLVAYTVASRQCRRDASP
jgi:hypothetical protein